jgi:predicted ATPase
MLTSWKVFNFKSIREETELDLAPLTIFAGANSSGKSTFIQSILLVAQTLAHRVGSRSVVLNGALASLGQFDDLKSNGGVSDQITIKFTCRPLPVKDAAAGWQSGFEYRGPLNYTERRNLLHEIACEFSFDADASSSQRDQLQIQPRLFATRLSCIYTYRDRDLNRDRDIVGQKADISVHLSTKAIPDIEGAHTASDIDDQQLRASLAYAVELDDVSMAEVRDDYRTAKPIGCMLRHFLPRIIVYSIDTIEEDANTIAMALQEDLCRSIITQRYAGRDINLPEETVAVLREVLEGTIDFDLVFKVKNRQEPVIGSKADTLSFSSLYERLCSLPLDELLKVQLVLREREDLFDRIHQAMKASTAEKPETPAFVSDSPPRLIKAATVYLHEFFASSLKYLGPLRDAPKSLYPLAPAADPYDVGLRGENTASILELYKNEEISYIPSANFKEPEIDRKTVTRTLEAAVIDWLQYLGVASSVKSRDKGKMGHELKVLLSNSDSPQDLTHVGVGVSQVLPLLVMGLLADRDSTLVFEQPELHLHPKVQTLLGDFFLSMALCGKQCIVETHSEYFIDRLRFRIAAATPEKELNSQAKIYFVEKPSQGSTFREVVINEYGAITDWPEGFFDQSQKQTEEILISAAMKRKANRRNKVA